MTSQLDVQLKLLTFTRGKTKGIIEKANSEGIKRHREALRAIVKKVESVKTQIEQAKLEGGVQVDELGEWSAGVEAQQATAERVLHKKKQQEIRQANTNEITGSTPKSRDQEVQFSNKENKRVSVSPVSSCVEVNSIRVCQNDEVPVVGKWTA